MVTMALYGNCLIILLKIYIFRLTGWYLKSLILQFRVVCNYYCTISFGVQMGEELMNFVLEVN